MNGAVRAWLLAGLAVAVWILSVALSQPHRTLAASAPAATFSSTRAAATLARVLGPEKPHPLSSAGSAAVRTRILQQFAALGMPARTYQAFSCNTWRGFGFIPCATVTDIIAEVVPGQGRAIVMMAHYDSVPAGPGASDDEAGVAAVLETARALKASAATSTHPVMALITDGEEAGLLGANAFLQNGSLKQRVGVVINVDERGTSGSSLLFQTSPGDARLIDLYAAHVPQMTASSMYAEIYKYLPNDTDLTLFIRAGFPSVNFAFADNVRYYHSPLDLRRNLSAASLQMQGDDVLGMVRALEHTPYSALRGGNAVYLSVFNSFLPRIASSWVLPLAIVAFIGLAMACWLASTPQAAVSATHAARILAVLMPPALIVGCVASGFILMFIARLLSGMPDPSYAHPIAMRIALAFGVWTMTLLATRMTDAHGATVSAWLWIGAIGIVTAALLPGLSPYWVFPALIGAVLLLATARAPGGWSGRWGQIAVFVGALVILIIWIALVAAGEILQGLALHPMFTIPAAFALLTIVPLLAARPMRRRGWTASIIGSGAAALAAAVIAGLLPAYSVASPQRVDLIYFEDQDGARWIADSSWKAQRTEPIAPALMQAGGFKLMDTRAYSGLSTRNAYVAPAGAARLALPTAAVVKLERGGTGRTLRLQLRGSSDTDEMILYIPAAAKLRGIDLRGQHLIVPAGWSGSTRLLCASRDCRDEQVTLTLAGDVSQLRFAEKRYGLPAFGAFLEAARPDTAMASQSGDQVVLANGVALR